MWIALLIVAALGLRAAAKNFEGPIAPNPLLRTGAESPPRYIPLLHRVIKAGKTPQRWLVDEAVREAFEAGDWPAVSAIAARFPLSPPTSQATPDVVVSDGETTESNAAIIIGKNSPFEGVSNDEWAEFCEKLKTQKADYESDKHVGAYHHNRERLNQLSIDPSTLKDEAAQLAALEKDIEAYRKTERKLIDDFGGDLIDIDGATHPVSMSGVLGVLKAAGPKHARSWFKNAEDRSAFKHTTETFLRTNGLF